MDDRALVRRDDLMLSRPYRSPSTESERRLASIWREVLTMDRVGVDDTYTELGGDSLMAQTMFAMIEAEFGRPVPLAILLEAQSIAELAGQIDRLDTSSKH